ncbi:CRISPR-associated helicase/endonuclease Cas3 [Paenibacillus sp. J2TS4]|nr:CRISPR-associated helicase/endonuclease Cas3 [Paenibacillus sp. J2TS4]
MDHSTAGGKLIYQLFHEGDSSALDQLTAEWISMCILSHHGGLRDFISPDIASPYLERVKFKEIPEFEHAVATFFKQQIGWDELENYFNQAAREVEAIVTQRQQQKLQVITFSFILKYIFSCLIDADRTNTRIFEEENEEPPESPMNSTVLFKKCYAALMDKIDSYRTGEDAHHPINLLRSKMSDQCEAAAYKPPGMYTLSIPTGGGKTLASLRYALKHAIEYGKERIIYIVPYTTIIEQNAEDIRKILGNEIHILEHHSNVIEEQEEEEEAYDQNKKKLKLAKDNWDNPIIFTTMVQFLNVFFARGTRNVRRLHNLANSVLIFDEVQSVPVQCISLFNEALNFLSHYGRSSIVLCTATQPALDFVENKLKIPTDAEIIQDLELVTDCFKRVKIVDNTTPDGYNANELKALILTEMEKVDSLLVILNTKQAVRKLYTQLNDKAEREHHRYEMFHLSTGMCPAHRKEILEEVRKNLATGGRRVICVSTQLIEAGVDISFQCVVRSLAGLDSIAQAAGRCNRHGKDEIRNVYVIKSADEQLSKLKEIRIGAEKSARILDEFERKPDEFGNDLLSPEAMTKYFEYYYTEIKYDLNYRLPVINQEAFKLLSLNEDNVTALQRKSGMNTRLISKQSFAAVERYFEVIDQPTTSVLVPFNDEANEIIADLNGELDSEQLTSLLRRAQQYVINIYTHELKQLDQDNNIKLLLHGNVYALKEVAYSKEMGLDLEGEAGWSLEIM